MKAAHWFPPDLDSELDEDSDVPSGFYLTPDEEQCECGGIEDAGICPYCTPLPPPAIDELSRAELAHDADVEALLDERTPEETALSCTDWAVPRSLDDSRDSAPRRVGVPGLPAWLWGQR